MSVIELIRKQMGDVTADEIGKDIATLDKKHKVEKMHLKMVYRVLAEDEGIEPDYDTARKAAAKAQKEESEQ